MTTKETLLDWLRDAHAMESSIVTLLEKQSEKLKDRPELQAKVNEHLQVTKEQRERVKGLIENLGGDVSKVKETTGKVLSNLQSMMMGAAPDAAVKNMIANFAVEHFEIASYRSLIAAAESQGQAEVARVCREILDQEVEMANWIEHHIPRVTNEFLTKEQTARS